MNLKIGIKKLGSHDYVAVAIWNEVEALSPAHYPDIETAIRLEAACAVDFASFVEFEYAGMSTGTYKTASMARDAGQHAKRLADLHRSSKHLKPIHQN